MIPRCFTRAWLAIVPALLALPAPAGAQPLVIPNQMAKSLTVELHSVADEVNIVPGDPQYLFAIEMRPIESEAPHIEFTNAAQVATLRVHDLSLSEDEQPASDTGKTGKDEDEEAPPEQPSTPRPASQTWNIKLMPPAPTTFLLQCDRRGKGVFDFTDMQVREVYLIGDSTALSLQFGRPNPVMLERLKVTAQAGKLCVRGLLNARPKLATLHVPGTECEIDLGGRPFAGQAEIFFEGVPSALRISLRRDVALRVDGPAAVVSRFDNENMERVGFALASHGYDSAACRLRLYFSEPIPKLEVTWSD